MMELNSQSRQAHYLVLMSGGIDSSAAVATACEISSEVSGVFVDYSQPAVGTEWTSAQAIANHFEVPITKLVFGFDLMTSAGEVFGRNALMVLAAAGNSLLRPLVVTLGIHASSEYYDTTPLFVRHLERLLDGYSEGDVSLFVPFIDMSKLDVIRFAMESTVRGYVNKCVNKIRQRPSQSRCL